MDGEFNCTGRFDQAPIPCDCVNMFHHLNLECSVCYKLQYSSHNIFMNVTFVNRFCKFKCTLN